MTASDRCILLCYACWVSVFKWILLRFGKRALRVFGCGHAFDILMCLPCSCAALTMWQELMSRKPVDTADSSVVFTSGGLLHTLLRKNKNSIQTRQCFDLSQRRWYIFSGEENVAFTRLPLEIKHVDRDPITCCGIACHLFSPSSFQTQGLPFCIRSKVVV